MRVGSLCTGYGGLDLAVDALLGTETVWLSEFDKNAAKVCEARFPGVPNLGDLTAVDWSTLEPVDVLTAGYPCQPFSHAGKRQGTDDVRHIWPHIRDALRVLRPRLAVFENVAGHLSLGFDTVLADLASIGFDVEWTVVRASDVGACHRRQRLFILATDAHGEGSQGRRWDDVAAREMQAAAHDRNPATDADSAGGEARNGRSGTGVAGRLQPVVGGDSHDANTHGPPWDAEGGAGEALRESRAVERPGRCGGVAWGDFGPAIERHARLAGRAAPRPTDDRGRLSAHFVEWMMCLPAGWVTDILPRNPALKALGNGVVPPQAAYAIGHLLDRLDEAEAA